MIQERAGCNWKCPKCNWDAPENLTNSLARLAYTEHLHEIHIKPGGSEVGKVSISAKVELELDKIIKKAMEWPEPQEGVWDSNEIARLRNELEKAKATAIGRGLATAIWYIEGGDLEGFQNKKYRTVDDVIRAAVERYQNPIPEDSHMGISPSEQAKAAPAKTAPAKLDDEMRARIKDALDGNFEPSTLASMFKVSVAEVEACR